MLFRLFLANVHNSCAVLYIPRFLTVGFFVYLFLKRDLFIIDLRNALFINGASFARTSFLFIGAKMSKFDTSMSLILSYDISSFPIYVNSFNRVLR